MNIPVIALSQLSRKVEDEKKTPIIRPERVWYHWTRFWFSSFYIEEYYLARSEPTEGTEKHNEWVQKMSTHNVAEAIIAKHRHGPISKVKLHFNASSTKFSDFVDTNDF